MFTIRLIISIHWCLWTLETSSWSTLLHCHSDYNHHCLPYHHPRACGSQGGLFSPHHSIGVGNCKNLCLELITDIRTGNQKSWNCCSPTWVVLLWPYGLKSVVWDTVTTVNELPFYWGHLNCSVGEKWHFSSSNLSDVWIEERPPRTE